MSTSLFSLIFAGVVGSGVFVGTLQQNVLKTEKPYIDFLFEEIEKDIRKFSEENPLSQKDADAIKEGPKTSSGSDSVSRKRRDTESDEKVESKNTLGIWTDIWVGLLSDYISDLWIGNQKNINASTTLKEEVRHFSDQEKQEAIKKADKENKEEKERFEEKLEKEKNVIEDIYEKMKDFILKIEFPATYKYNPSYSDDIPYENYIKDILKK